MKIPIHIYYCENGAYHEYLCCKTCANKYKEDINSEDDFRLSHSKEIEQSRKEWFIKNARTAGFKKKQAEFLYNNR